MMQNQERQAGFTLVELLIVIAIIGLLATIGLTALWSQRDEANSQLAAERLKEVHSHLSSYERRRERLPKDSGPEFVLAIWGEPFVDKSVQNSRVMFCPSLGNEEVTEDTIDEDVTAETIHWAGRNQADKKYKVRRTNDRGASKKIIACNKAIYDGTMPHGGKFLAAVFLDGSTKVYERADWGEDWGTDEPLLIGPESPIDALQGVIGDEE